jgi:hypothetical protein
MFLKCSNSARGELRSGMQRLGQDGFVIVAGPALGADLLALSSAYDGFVAAAGPSAVKAGSTSVRAGPLVNAGPRFDPIYVHPPLLAAARAVIGAPFKLSAFHARTLRPNGRAEELHQDFRPLSDGWPMVGFILMVDAFSRENGATRFLAGSQGRPSVEPDPQGVSHACGPAGSMIIYNGSVWHGHGTNSTGHPRRSIQGALIRWDQQAAVDHPADTEADTRARLGATALALLGL